MRNAVLLLAVLLGVTACAGRLPERFRGVETRWVRPDEVNAYVQADREPIPGRSWSVPCKPEPDSYRMPDGDYHCAPYTRRGLVLISRMPADARRVTQ